MRHKFNRTNSDLSKKTILTKTQKFNKTPPVLAPCCYGIKIKCVCLRFHILRKFRYRRKTCGAKRSLSFTASPGVKRARKPSVYFFGTFFVQAKKVHIVPHPHGSREGAHTLRVLFWNFFRTSEKSAYRPHPHGSREGSQALRVLFCVKNVFFLTIVELHTKIW